MHTQRCKTQIAMQQGSPRQQTSPSETTGIHVFISTAQLLFSHWPLSNLGLLTFPTPPNAKNMVTVLYIVMFQERSAKKLWVCSHGSCLWILLESSHVDDPNNRVSFPCNALLQKQQAVPQDSALQLCSPVAFLDGQAEWLRKGSNVRLSVYYRRPIGHREEVEQVA